MKQGHVDDIKKQMIDLDRIDEDLEDFLGVGKGKFFALDSEKMKP
jgi:hypothetical protein